MTALADRGGAQPGSAGVLKVQITSIARQMSGGGE